MPGTYDRLTRTQKLATFLIVIGPEAAAHLLKQFEDEDVEVPCKEMTSIKAIEEEDQKRAIEEFSGVILSSYGSLFGGPFYTRKALEIAKRGFQGH